MKYSSILAIFFVFSLTSCDFFFPTTAASIIPGSKWICREFQTRSEYDKGQYPEIENPGNLDTTELYGTEGEFMSYYADTGEPALGTGLEKGKYKIEENKIFYTFYEDGRWWDWDEHGISIQNLSKTTFDLIDESEPDYPLYVKCAYLSKITEK